ncbi:MAG: hypothetical protein HY391_00760 [Deltaproteobacteria bacterium]|nr:hypothetical protein [Deltaproteobacteria bacterium]
MEIIRLGTNIWSTVKNIGRVKTIATTMAKHGLATVAEKLELNKVARIPSKVKKKSEKEAAKFTLPQRLRMCFEELGPTYVKLGQLLSMRPDLIPPDFIAEFQLLQDTVSPSPFAAIKRAIETEIGGPLEDHFKEFDHKPFASASIAQVYKAELRDGTAVVVKVQRPHIEGIIEGDVQILELLASLMEHYLPELRVFNPTGIVKEFAKTIRRELNFKFEANHINRIARNFEGDARLKVPKVFSEYSTERILTLEQIDGIRITDIAALKKANIDPALITHTGVQVFYKMMLIDGLFHGDLHAGNIFVTGPETLALVDFGIVGYLSRQLRDSIANIFLALVEEDYETLACEMLEIGRPRGSINMEHLQQGIRDIVEPYYGLSLKDINVGRLLIDVTLEASRHSLRVPRDVMLLSRALLTLEGTGRILNPDFNLLEEMSDFSKVLVRDRYSPERIIKDLIRIVRDANSLLRVMPRQLKQILNKLAAEEYTLGVSIEGLPRSIQRLTISRHIQTGGIFASALILASTAFIISETEPYVFGVSAWGLGALLLAFFLSTTLFWIAFWYRN